MSTSVVRSCRCGVASCRDRRALSASDFVSREAVAGLASAGRGVCQDAGMLLLQGVATRWIADDPQPGLVQIEITDAGGRVHRLEEKAAVLDAVGLLGAHTNYPVEIQIACLPHHQENRLAQERPLNVVDLSPWGLDDPAVLYPVQRDQLSWAAPSVYSDLSVCGRQAGALVTFRRWRESVGLDSDELTTLEDHLWQYATVTPETFNAWYESHPLARLGQDEPLPADLQDSVAARGLGLADVWRAVNALVQITYGGLFGRIESQWSLNELEVLGEVTARYGVPLAPADAFAQCLWIDHDWGRPDAELVSLWQTTE